MTQAVSATQVQRRAARTRKGGRLRRIAVGLFASAERHEQNVATAVLQIWANKARASLTTLGIIIAVFSTITVVSFVQGFGNYVTGMLRDLGTNLVFVLPHDPSGDFSRTWGRIAMDIHDVRAVSARCSNVRRISPAIFDSKPLEFGREKLDSVQLQGVTEQYQSIRSWSVDHGRFISPLEVERAAPVCVLGADVVDLLGANHTIVGDFVHIDNLRFLVVGVLEAKGKMMGDRPDEVVMIPFTTAVKMTPFLREFMPFAIEVTSEEATEETALQITRVLRESHDIPPGAPNDFRVMRQDELLRDFDKVKMIATSALAGIVGISLIVGGIGIMNVMLISVTERTREIGLRKAIGARRRDILSQFLTESAALATFGGLAGVALGYAVCGLASMHPAMVDVPVPLWVAAIALAFSAGVGVVFGLIPALKAAILPPIDALRHE